MLFVKAEADDSVTICSHCKTKTPDNHPKISFNTLAKSIPPFNNC